MSSGNCFFQFYDFNLFCDDKKITESLVNTIMERPYYFEVLLFKNDGYFVDWKLKLKWQ